ncbi:peptide chain release factor N(5)-glutamine methyltransferase [Thalassobacillus pellis]|uniref:peptide chain release factor N(5)-glutamine methyltransferase n=1 Tax=Thalassobacillus pellis TaxID=748008 RepID=UPI00195F3527|nr:peptide chain release factor N(5)-glutamine methyltransferase [Thalassobacillus pellis]
MDLPFKTIQEARRWASLFLKNNQREERVGDILLEHHLGMSFTQMLVYERDSFPSDKREDFINDVQRHAETGIPVQHLIGHSEFYGRRFHVNSHVLIPRQETEELVEGVLSFIGEIYSEKPLTIVDIGTGSGAIACTLALEHPQSKLHATDISPEAIETASRNAEELQASVSFHQGNFLSPLPEDTNPDIIVSNPPYISETEAGDLSDTVSEFDPHLALFADENGLAAYREIIGQIRSCDFRPSLIVFEIGHQQGEIVKKMIQDTLTGYQAEIRKDLNGKPRMVFAKNSIEEKC